MRYWRSLQDQAAELLQLQKDMTDKKGKAGTRNTADASSGAS